MNQRDLFFKWLFYGVASLIFILLQGLVLNRLCIRQVHPFVFPILVAAASVLEPPNESMVYSLVLGVLCDLTLPGMFPCFYTVVFLLASLLSALIAEKLIVPGFWCCTVCGALSVVLCDVFNVLIVCYRHDTRFVDGLNLASLELLLSVVLVPLVYFLFHRINLRVTQD